MKIALVDASPKMGASNSGKLLERLRPLLGEGHEISACRIGVKNITSQLVEALCRQDVLVLAFPLYWDSIPAHLLEVMLELELEPALKERGQDMRVYGLINNGFYEGGQCGTAMRLLEQWCSSCGVSFCGGMGQGAGEMVGGLSKVPLGHGPLKTLGVHMEELARQIREGGSMEPVYASPNFPRVLWKAMGTHQFWNGQAKKNGLSKKDIIKQM